MKISEKQELDAGSRMHVLDWLETPDFVADVRNIISKTGLSIADNAARQPKRRGDHRESVLTGSEDTFLTSFQKSDLLKWWLIHQHGAKLPTWDLVVQAKAANGAPALVLFEAKAHICELSDAGKTEGKRKQPDEQSRTHENHEKIASAIKEASDALAKTLPSINLTHTKSYQFANRIAFAWKLASMGIPVALVYLGFVGDETISTKSDNLSASADWHNAFEAHVKDHFPIAHLDREIPCGAASFWLICHGASVQRSSPPVSERCAL